MAGVATFSGLQVNSTAGNPYTLAASDTTNGAITGATSNNFTISAGAANKLAFTIQPGNGTAGSALATQPKVTVEDNFGNPVTSGSGSTDTIKVTLSSQTFSGGSTTASVSAVAGVATFSGLQVNTTAGNPYTLAASDTTNGAITGATSNNFTISAGAANKLAFTIQPGNGTAGSALATQPAVTIEDNFGNPVTSGSGSTDTIKVTLSSGTFSGGSTTASVSAVAGVATFSGLQVNSTAGNPYTLAASDTTNGAITGATSNNFTISAGAANKLAFTIQPGNGTAGSALATQPKVTVEDNFGNPVTSGSGSTDTIKVTLSSQTFSGGSTTASVSAVAGVATFSGLQVNTTAGNPYTLAASDTTNGAITGATSNNFTISAGAANKLAFTIQPGNGTAGSALATQPAVTIEDNFGNPVTSGSGSTDTIKVTLSSGTFSGGSTTASVSAVAGVATFSGLQVNSTAGNPYTLAASDTTNGAITGATSNNFTISAGAANKLAFTIQPGNGTAGSALVTQPAVTIEDNFGNPVTSGSGSTDTIKVTLSSGTFSTGLSTASVNAVAGVATFSGLQVNSTAGNPYTLAASDTTNGAITGATSNNFTISAGAANKLAFTIQPGNGTAGSALATQPKVTVEDNFGNPVTSGSGSTDTIKVTLSSQTFSGGSTTASVSAVAGVATFSGLQVNTTAGNPYTLAASDTTNGAITGATSNNFTISAGAANKLAFTIQPGNGTAGSALATQPAVTIEDNFGNPVTSGSGSTDTIKVTLSSGTFSGGSTTASVSAVAGVATFSGLQVNSTAGNPYTLAASDTTNGAITGATSNNFTISAGTATQVVFSVQPVGGVLEGTNFATQPKASIEDANGNVVTSNTAGVTLGIASYTAGNGGSTQGTLTCTNNTVNAVAGVATFTGCQITGTAAAGTYTLSATQTGLPVATSTNVVINSGSATKLVFTTQPVGGVTAGNNFATQPKVSVEDTNGNVVTSDTGTVALAVGTYTPGNGGTVQGTLACANNTVNAVAGVATFTGCQITGTSAAGTYFLTATRTGLTVPTSNGVVINAGSASKLAFSVQPVGGVIEGTAFATEPQVTVQDSSGNTITSDTGTVTLSIASYTAGNGGTTQGTLTCTNNTVNAVAGVASFLNCKITGPAAAGTYTLSAARTGLTSATSNNVSIIAGAATTIATSSGTPQSTAISTAFTNPLVALVTDTNGNGVSGITVTYTVPTSGASATISGGTTAVTNASGLATSGTVTANATAGTYNITAKATGTSPATVNFAMTNLGSTTVTETTSGTYTLTVPAHITSFTFTMTGAGGGGGSCGTSGGACSGTGGAGGAGGKETGTITIPNSSTATTFTVVVGDNGTGGTFNNGAAGTGGITGWALGGNGGQSTDNSAGGGGAATAIYVTKATPIVVVGGGGGGTYNGVAGGAGSGGAGSNGGGTGPGQGGTSCGNGGAAGTGGATTGTAGGKNGGAGGNGGTGTGGSAVNGGGGGGGGSGSGGGGAGSTLAQSAGGGGGGAGCAAGDGTNTVSGATSTTGGGGAGGTGGGQTGGNGTDGSVSFTGIGLTLA